MHRLAATVLPLLATLACPAADECEPNVLVQIPSSEVFVHSEITSAPHGALWWVEIGALDERDDFDGAGELTLQPAAGSAAPIAARIEHRTARVAALRVPDDAVLSTRYRVPGSATTVEAVAGDVPAAATANDLELTFIRERNSGASLVCGELFDGESYRGSVLGFADIDAARTLLDIWVSVEADSPLDDLTPRRFDSALLTESADQFGFVNVEQQTMAIVAVPEAEQLVVRLRDVVDGTTGAPLSLF